MRAPRVPGTSPAGRRSAPKHTAAFDFESPSVIVNLMGQLLGQGQQREVLTVATRAFLSGKGYPDDTPFVVRITGARITANPPTAATAVEEPPAAHSAEGE